MYFSLSVSLLQPTKLYKLWVLRTKNSLSLNPYLKTTDFRCGFPPLPFLSLKISLFFFFLFVAEGLVNIEFIIINKCNT